MKSLARGGSLVVLQLAAASRDDEASGVAFLLCLTRMDLSLSLFSAPWHRLPNDLLREPGGGVFK